MVTEFNKMLSGGQPRQDVKFCRCFTGWLCLHLQGVLVDLQNQSKQLNGTIWNAHRRQNSELPHQKDKAGLLYFRMRKVILVDLQPWGTSVNPHYTTETKQYLNATFVKSVLLEKYQNLFLHINDRPHTSLLVPLRPSHILDSDYCQTGPIILTSINQIFTCLVAYRQPARLPSCR